MYQKQKEEEKGFHSVFYSMEQKPLQNLLEKWHTKVRNGHIKRLNDPDVQFSVLEIMGTNVNHVFMQIPNEESKSLGIRMPILVILAKNLRKYFTFEVQILDDKNIRRTFSSSNFQSTTRVKPFSCSMPMKLDEGWNEVLFNLADFCKRAFGTNYVETVRIRVNANCRLARIYFNNRVYSEDQIPAEYKLFLRVQAAKEQ